MLAIAAVATVAAAVPGTAVRPIVPPVHLDATAPGPTGAGASGASHGHDAAHHRRPDGRHGATGKSTALRAGPGATPGAGSGAATPGDGAAPSPAPPSPAPGPDPATTTASTAPEPCAPWQVQVSATTGAGTYGPGQPVTAASVLTQVAGPPCVLALTGGSGVPCGVQLSFDNAPGTSQYWPWPGQVVPCPATGDPVLATGDTETATQTWDQQAMSSSGQAVAAPPGTYCATGEWSWSGPAGQVLVVTGRSAPFTVQ